MAWRLRTTQNIILVRQRNGKSLGTACYTGPMILTFPDILPQIATPTRRSTTLHLCVRFVNFASSTLSIPALAMWMEGRQLCVRFVNFGLWTGFQAGLMKARFTVQFVNFYLSPCENEPLRKCPSRRCFTVQFVNFAATGRLYLAVLKQSLFREGVAAWCKPWCTNANAALHRSITARYHFDYSRNVIDIVTLIRYFHIYRIGSN